MDRRRFMKLGGAAVVTPFMPRRAFPFLWGGAENVSFEGGKLPLLFGADYYPDQTPESKWKEDAAAMTAMGITNVRIAEFAWALMEPQEGSFEFAWLERAIGILRDAGIAIILGTPSAAPPPWLTAKYPEVLMVNDHGVQLSPGSRRFTCPTNKTYRRLSLAIATEMAKTFAKTPGVIGWQIDNELTLGSLAAVTAATAERDSNSGCVIGTARSMQSTRRGARCSGAIRTRISHKFRCRFRRALRRIPGSRWTTTAIKATQMFRSWASN